MNGLIALTKLTSFHLKWLFMSSEEKYAYLWGKTRKLIDSGYSIPNTIVVTAKDRR